MANAEATVTTRASAAKRAPIADTATPTTASVSQGRPPSRHRLQAQAQAHLLRSATG